MLQGMTTDGRRAAAIKRAEAYVRLLDINALNCALQAGSIRLPEWESEEVSQVLILMATLDEAGMIRLHLRMTIGDATIARDWLPGPWELLNVFSRLQLSMRSSQ